MIPKKIHYCWFGNKPLPKQAKKCIDSWKKYCPDYEIIEWNENNFDINMNAYTAMCYEQKKYAFLTDYVRLLVVYECGGIYFDTDVEVIRTYDNLLNTKAFFGFENDQFVATGLGFGSEAGNEVVKQMIQEYDCLLEGMNGTITCPRLNTDALIKFGLQLNGIQQTINDVIVYPVDFFNPYDDLTGRLKVTNNTYSIHWYNKSWMSKKVVLKSKFTKPLHRLFGIDFWDKVKDGKKIWN